jgi:hypothetical protein
MKYTVLDAMLIASMVIATLITGYITMRRIFYNEVHLSYDAWIFAMCLAISLQLFENFATNGIKLV